eukprot:scaffold82366_cov19-Tisochrysis_lutea.AAC.7
MILLWREGRHGGVAEAWLQQMGQALGRITGFMLHGQVLLSCVGREGPEDGAAAMLSKERLLRVILVPF